MQEEAANSLPAQWKSSRLREFQARLLDRIGEARDGIGMRDSRLGVVVGERHYLLDLREASEIVNPMPVTKVPLTKDWYLGLANVRGNLIGVVDLDRFFGGELQARSKDNRVIVVSAALSGTAGFVVSRVLGLRHLQEMSPQEDEDGGDVSEIIKGKRYLDRSRQEWVEISLAAVINDARFLQVGL